MNKIFLDTNILVSTIDTTRVNHKKAIKLIEKIKSDEYQAFISTQIIGEFYVSLTRNFGGITAPLSPDEARKEKGTENLKDFKKVTDVILVKYLQEFA